MGIVAQFSKLTGLAYDAAAGDVAWSDFIHETAKHFDAAQAVLTTAAPDSGWGVPVGEQHVVERVHVTGHPGDDPLMNRVWALPRGTISSVQYVETDPVVGRTDFYRNFLAQNGLRHFIHVLLPQAQGRIAFFCLVREDDQQGFSSDEVELIEALMPHLHRAVRRAPASLHPSLFETSSYGLLLLDPRGVVTASNPIARRLLESGDGMAVDACGELELRGHSALSRLIGGMNKQGPQVLRLDRHSGELPVDAMLSPVPAEWLALGSRPPAALLVLNDPLTVSLPDLAVLMELYDLTPREARFAAAFVEARGLNPVSERLGIARETARRHLKSLFEKTSTHSQSELMHLLVRHPAAQLQGR